MKIAAKDLHAHIRRILTAVERGQEVVITVRGKARAKIVPMQEKKVVAARKGTALFGIWKDNPKSRDVEIYVDRLRNEYLSAADWETLCKTLSRPPKPNRKMKKGFRWYRTKTV